MGSGGLSRVQDDLIKPEFKPRSNSKTQTSAHPTTPPVHREGRTFQERGQTLSEGKLAKSQPRCSVCVGAKMGRRERRQKRGVKALDARSAWGVDCMLSAKRADLGFHDSLAHTGISPPRSLSNESSSPNVHVL